MVPIWHGRRRQPLPHESFRSPLQQAAEVASSLLHDRESVGVDRVIGSLARFLRSNVRRTSGLIWVALEERAQLRVGWVRSVRLAVSAIELAPDVTPSSVSTSAQ